MFSRQVRNLVIGSNRNKTSMMACGIVQKLLQVLTSVDTPADILVECAVIMGSLAQGTDSNRTELMEEGVMAIMMQGRFCFLLE
ncbi:Armadillo repeat-containing protein 8 [Holothuria leucospilota]|uniref:Armadillo repeat-containing protein 8 n=1 Tax=Holothuria leucospilota TaxID=206669 RepID=A0A9Q0YDH6_HOLLE|nr:Armadillo repeat-containing protein 8 [Holothuria leucospilota]